MIRKLTTFVLLLAFSTGSVFSNDTLQAMGNYRDSLEYNYKMSAISILTLVSQFKLGGNEELDISNPQTIEESLLRMDQLMAKVLKMAKKPIQILTADTTLAKKKDALADVINELRIIKRQILSEATIATSAEKIKDLRAIPICTSEKYRYYRSMVGSLANIDIEYLDIDLPEMGTGVAVDISSGTDGQMAMLDFYTSSDAETTRKQNTIKVSAFVASYLAVSAMGTGYIGPGIVLPAAQAIVSGASVATGSTATVGAAATAAMAAALCAAAVAAVVALAMAIYNIREHNKMIREIHAINSQIYASANHEESVEKYFLFYCNDLANASLDAKVLVDEYKNGEKSYEEIENILNGNTENQTSSRELSVDKEIYDTFMTNQLQQFLVSESVSSESFQDLMINRFKEIDEGIDTAADLLTNLIVDNYRQLGQNDPFIRELDSNARMTTLRSEFNKLLLELILADNTESKQAIYLQLQLLLQQFKKNISTPGEEGLFGKYQKTLLNYKI